jgi:hypothetical protein
MQQRLFALASAIITIVCLCKTPCLLPPFIPVAALVITTLLTFSNSNLLTLLPHPLRVQTEYTRVL